MNELTRIPLEEQTADELRVELERSRAKVSASVDALRDDLQRSVLNVKRGAQVIQQSRKWMARHPWGLVAAGLAIGLLLGSRRRP